MNKILINTNTHSTEETEAIGAELAELLLKERSRLPLFLALYGDLGVGKTAFTRGIASVISPTSSVRSPTFALVNQYKSDKIPFYHFDMYRITDDDDLYSIGFYDYLSTCEADKALCVVEWSENIPYALPERYIKIMIEKLQGDADQRRITVELVSE